MFSPKKVLIIRTKSILVGIMQKSQLSKVPFQKQLVGSLALIVLGFNFTKRFYTFPHHHKDESKPMVLLNGDLHPFEHQPAVRISFSYI